MQKLRCQTFLSVTSSNSFGRPGPLIVAKDGFRLCSSWILRISSSLSLKIGVKKEKSYKKYLFRTNSRRQRTGNDKRKNCIFDLSDNESVGVTFWLTFNAGGAFEVGGTRVISIRDSS